jgi:predicted metal-binding membrane protein
MLSRASDGRTLLESALKHERVVTATLIVVIPLICWTWIALMAQDMYGTMLGPSAWMMTAEWDAPHLLLLWAMWAVMMTAMMLPSAAPLVLLYAGALRASGDGRVGGKTYALAAGYVLVWALFSVAATVLQRLLSTALVLTPMMEPSTSGVAAVLLAIAGLYQLTPLKAACLRVCRSPLSYLLQHWAPGTFAAFRLGALHGTYCLACCWALMLLLFAGGVMSLPWIAGLSLFVLFEKLSPFGERGDHLTGALLLIAAAGLVAHGARIG